MKFTDTPTSQTNTKSSPPPCIHHILLCGFCCLFVCLNIFWLSPRPLGLPCLVPLTCLLKQTFKWWTESISTLLTSGQLLQQRSGGFLLVCSWQRGGPVRSGIGAASGTDLLLWGRWLCTDERSVWLQTRRWVSVKETHDRLRLTFVRPLTLWALVSHHTGHFNTTSSNMNIKHTNHEWVTVHSCFCIVFCLSSASSNPAWTSSADSAAQTNLSLAFINCQPSERLACLTMGQNRVSEYNTHGSLWRVH